MCLFVGFPDQFHELIVEEVPALVLIVLREGVIMSLVECPLVVLRKNSQIIP